MVMNDADLDWIDKIIQKVEKTTSGEIVLLVRPSSDPYTRINWALAMAGWLVASSAFLMLGSWHLSVLSLLSWQMVAATAGWFMGDVSGLKRKLLTQKIIRYRVHREAMASFLSHGLHRTREHTGVLIYLSQLEHQVEIVADSGIHQKVGESYWQARVKEIVDGIRAGRPKEALIETIEKIGGELSEHFPPRPDNPDELPNTL